MGNLDLPCLTGTLVKIIALWLNLNFAMSYENFTLIKTVETQFQVYFLYFFATLIERFECSFQLI